MNTLQQRLFSFRDAEYAAFQAKLTPGIPLDSFIGVRIPQLRKFAKAYAKEPDSTKFMQDLPHTYYDENMLHALLIAEVGDYERCMELTKQFLPYVDNWAVCDVLSPKVFRRHRPELLPNIHEWCSSSHTYTCRFGLEMLMTHFLDADFRPEYLELASSVRSNAYYVRMMVAWFFATALAKQWDATLPYIKHQRLAPWTHNKTIQKARESFRITPEQKELLKTMRITKGNQQEAKAYK